MFILTILINVFFRLSTIRALVDQSAHYNCKVLFSNGSRVQVHGMHGHCISLYQNLQHFGWDPLAALSYPYNFFLRR